MGFNGIVRTLPRADGPISRHLRCPSASRGQPQPHQQPAKILAFFQADRAFVDFGDVAHDGETQPGAGLAGIETGAAVEDADALFLGDADAVILDHVLQCSAVGSPTTVERGIAAFVERTKVDELMVVSSIYDVEARRKSVAIAAKVMRGATVAA